MTPEQQRDKLQKDMVDLIRQFEEKEMKVAVLFQDESCGMGITRTDSILHAHPVISRVLWPIMCMTLDAMNEGHPMDSELREVWIRRVSELASEAQIAMTVNNLVNGED